MLLVASEVLGALLMPGACWVSVVENCSMAALALLALSTTLWTPLVDCVECVQQSESTLQAWAVTCYKHHTPNVAHTLNDSARHHPEQIQHYPTAPAPQSVRAV